jgi:hypothetical protein
MTVMEELSDRSNWGELLQKVFIALGTITLQDGPVYLTTPLAVLEKVEEPEVTMVCLTMIYDLLTRHTQRAAQMLQEAHLGSFQALSRLVLSGDEIIAGIAARILAILAL